jgi:hypothetical protein
VPSNSPLKLPAARFRGFAAGHRWADGMSSTCVRSLAVGLVVFCVAALPGHAVAAEGKSSKALPKEAAAAVRAAADAAKKKDFTALRRLMTDKFTWSFGGDADANQAIDEWKKDGRYLTQLVRVLGAGCHPAGAEQVECPGRGGLSFRAGFLRTGKVWKLSYFVEGD